MNTAVKTQRRKKMRVIAIGNKGVGRTYSHRHLKYGLVPDFKKEYENKNLEIEKSVTNKYFFKIREFIKRNSVVFLITAVLIILSFAFLSI